MHNKRRQFPGGLLILLIAVGLLTPFSSVTRAAETGFIRVMDLTMRSGPDKKTRPIKTLERGALVTILGRRGNWLKVRHNKHSGYILNEAAYIRLIDEVPLIEEGGGKTAAASQPSSREEIEAQLKSSTAELIAMKDQEMALVNAVDQAERQVNNKRQQMLATEADLGALEKRIQIETGELATLDARVETNAAYAGRRVRALYQLNSLGTLPVLANAESWMDFLKRKTALATVLEADRRTLDDLAADRQRQADLLVQLNTRRSEHVQLEQTLKQELAALTRSLTERTAMLAKIKSKESLQNHLIKGLQASARELDATITRLTKPVAQQAVPAPEAEAKTPIEKASGEAETRLAALTPPEPLTAPAPKAAEKPQPFNKLKGLLNLPVSGKIVSSYGHYRNAEFNVMNFRSGVLIRADRGEPIHAVANGTTLFADWFKGYGNMLILDHGDHYYTVYAHLEALFKARGESVDADEVIATVGDTATLAGPGLHFEIRHHGKPMDPLPWLRTTDRAASDRKKGVDG
jgi:murein hydrolase activator